MAAARAEASDPTPLPADPGDPAALADEFGTTRFEYTADGGALPLYDATADLAAIPTAAGAASRHPLVSHRDAGSPIVTTLRPVHA